MEKAHTVSADECEWISFHLTPTAVCSSWPFVHLHIRVSLKLLGSDPSLHFLLPKLQTLSRSNLGHGAGNSHTVNMNVIGVFSFSFFENVLLFSGSPFPPLRPCKPGKLVRH